MKPIAGIYILKNTSFPGFVKIGYSKDVEDTVEQLNSSEATPFPFRIFAIYEVPDGYDDNNSQQAIERVFLKASGTTVDELIRETRKRKFYSISDKDAYQTLHDLALLHGNEDKLQMFDTSEIEKVEADAVEKMHRGIKFGTKRKSPFRFSMIGLKPGDEVQLKTDLTRSFKIVSDREVEYEGKPYSLSALAIQVCAKSYGIQGPTFFCYNGETLDDIRKRMEKSGAVRKRKDE